MKFGKTWNQNAETTSEGGSSDYLRYFKDAETTFRVLQEPQDWVEYWEHFNPNGFPFPCTGDRQNCPGCTSSNEKMQKASKKIAIQVLQGEWVNAFKVPKTVADKLANRANRIGTVTDRDYTIYKVQSKNSDGSTKTDYDVEGNEKIPVDIASLEPKFKDVEAILSKMYDQSWGSGDSAMVTKSDAEESQARESLQARINREQHMEETREEPEWAAGKPAEEPNKVWTEEELRALSFEEILDVTRSEGMNVPQELRDEQDTNKVVDWLLDQ